MNVYATDGTILLAHGGIEMGQGINTKMMQIAAYTLNVPLEYIKMAPMSTSMVSTYCLQFNTKQTCNHW